MFSKVRNYSYIVNAGDDRVVLAPDSGVIGMSGASGAALRVVQRLLSPSGGSRAIYVTGAAPNNRDRGAVRGFPVELVKEYGVWKVLEF